MATSLPTTFCGGTAAPVVIDFPQAVDVRADPNNCVLLKRDLENLVEYFRRSFEVAEDRIYTRFGVGKSIR